MKYHMTAKMNSGKVHEFKFEFIEGNRPSSVANAVQMISSLSFITYSSDDKMTMLNIDHVAEMVINEMKE